MTEHQREMLKPVEKRISQLVFPKSIADRVTKKRGEKRQSRWSSKFRGIFLGKSSAKWKTRLAQGGREQLEVESLGQAKLSERQLLAKQLKLAKAGLGSRFMANTSRVLKASKAKRQQESRARREAKDKHNLEICEQSPWHERHIRVTNEGPNEGRVGVVQSVLKYCDVEPAEFRLQVPHVKI